MSLRMHLSDWPDTRAAQAGHAVEELRHQPGFQHLADSIAARADHLVSALVNTDPTENGAEYAAALAEIRALRSFPALVEAVIERGHEAEAKLREPVAA